MRDRCPADPGADPGLAGHAHRRRHPVAARRARTPSTCRWRCSGWPPSSPSCPGSAVRAGPDLTVALPDPPRHPTSRCPARRRPPRRRHGDLVPLAADGAATFPLAAPVTGTCRLVPLAFPLRRCPASRPSSSSRPCPSDRAGAAAAARPARPSTWRRSAASQLASRRRAGARRRDRSRTAGAAWVGPAVRRPRGALPGGLDRADRRRHERPRHRGRGGGLANARPVRRRERARAARARPRRPAGGRHSSSRVGPGRSTTATTDAGGSAAAAGGRAAAHAGWPRRGAVARPATSTTSLADPADRGTSTPPGEPLTIPAALTRRSPATARRGPVVRRPAHPARCRPRRTCTRDSRLRAARRRRRRPSG